MSIDILSKRISFIFAFTIAFTFYPLFFLLDVIMYPEHTGLILQIRLSTMGVFLLLLAVTRRLKEHVVMTLIFIAAAWSISVMCYATGDGFASSYYSGVVLCIIVSSVFFRIETRYYTAMTAIVLLLHFGLLSLLPFTFRDLMMNVFFLGSAALFTSLIHAIILYFSREVKTLSGFLPICAQCKKVRDDKGYWNQIEMYLKVHSGTQCTHGLCPECARALYALDGLEQP
ncbi:MAG: hypothetical protein KA248_09825 [Kiritimatiellae bacterium]|nr:hypothetical protein [Kiritimatiellia bacterium]